MTRASIVSRRNRPRATPTGEVDQIQRCREQNAAVDAPRAGVSGRLIALCIYRVGSCSVEC